MTGTLYLIMYVCTKLNVLPDLINVRKGNISCDGFTGNFLGNLSFPFELLQIIQSRYDCLNLIMITFTLSNYLIYTNYYVFSFIH